MATVEREKRAPREGWAESLRGEAGPGGLPCNSSSVKLEASRVAKAGAGTLFGFSGFNSKAGSQFVLVFDSDAVPSAGAIPVFVMTVPTVANFSADFGQWGRAFSRGIVLCNSSTSATLTIGAADTWFDVQYV